jgi:hypothetical protein
MRKKKKIIIYSILIFLTLMALVGPMILGCLAYYEQCTADKITGLTKEQCLQRTDVVAYLYHDNSCLVKAK